jgi:SOS-response transcriptional repressor LexA
MSQEKQARASKKQQELLDYVTTFIKENKYGPSYREIMRSLDYKSVSTVAIHIDGLIAKGLLIKKDKSARSLDVVRTLQPEINEHKTWLLKKVAAWKKKEQTEADIKTVESALDLLGISER